MVKSSDAVSGPSTTTLAASASSAAVRNRPLVTARERTVCQLEVVPVSVVVQLVVPLVSDTLRVTVGATAWTSGALAVELRASASWMVRVDDVPNPPREPELLVELPGETTRMFVPSWLISDCTWACAPWPSPTERITAMMPIRMPSMVSADRSRCVRTASTAVRKVSRQVITMLPRRWRRTTPRGSSGRRGR